jgi:putative ABC transport system ATP-binding protein
MANSKPIISLRDITKNYTTGDSVYKALKGVTFDIYEGEFVSIMGSSGSGKSTTMHIIGALDTPTSGNYVLNGKNISSYSEDQLAEIRNREIGFVFQSFNLLSRTTVLDNVKRPMMYGGVPSDKQDTRALECLRLVHLEEKAHNMSNAISGGQIQRVAIARALVMNPSLILADEPTGNLDTKTSYEVMNFLQELNQKGRTIVMITHEPDIAAFAKRILVLKDGEIISDKPNKQFFVKN